MKHLRTSLALVLVFGTLSAERFSAAAEPRQPGIRRIGLLDWHTDYLTAYEEARRERKQLLIFFRDETQSYVAESFQSNVLSADEMWIPLSGYVRAVLPLDTANPFFGTGEQPRRLIDHRAFGHLHKRQGIVVIDLVDPKSPQYGLLSAAHPFSRGKHYSLFSTKILLGLPRGTITQRALLYALRIHPQRIRNTNQGMNDFLAAMARSHSTNMAQTGFVGHQNWGSRVQTINAKLGSSYGLGEVAASGYGDTLVEAAIDCVDTWSGSPAHWSMITNNPLLYGYDLVRAAGNQWYATGIFADGM